MIKKVSLFFMMFLFLFSYTITVDASIIEPRISFDNEIDSDFNIVQGSETSVDCSGIFTSEALDLISDILGWFRIIAPILLILLVALDFGQAVLQQDNDALKKATSKIIKRALATVALFFVPTFIRVLINLPGVRSTIQIPDDPLCGTMTTVIHENDLVIK